MLDDTMGPAAAAALGGEGFAFLRAARPGKLCGDGRVVATATATARVIPFAARP